MDAPQQPQPQQALAYTPPVSFQTQPTTPMEMLARAITSGASPDIFERLLSLQERFERNEGRKLYDKAIAAAKAEIRPIRKNREANRGIAGTYQYEDMAAIENAVVPALSANGLSYRFRTSVEKDRIIVTCIVSHEGGYSEENSLAGPADLSGAKNPIQALGSTVTYLQRYALKAALGLSATKDDDDALATDAFFINREQTENLTELIEISGRPLELFCRKFMCESLDKLPASKYAGAVEFLQDIIKREGLGNNP